GRRGVFSGHRLYQAAAQDRRHARRFRGARGRWHPRLAPGRAVRERGLGRRRLRAGDGHGRAIPGAIHRRRGGGGLGGAGQLRADQGARPVHPAQDQRRRRVGGARPRHAWGARLRSWLGWGMAEIKIVIDGATGRLGTTQHLKALLAIRGEGGLLLKSGERLMPAPVLLGRNPEKLAALAERGGGLAWSTDREACLADKSIAIYFDANATGGRVSRLSAAIAAGKHVYTEKPLAETLDEAMGLARAANAAGLKNGVVQDKLFLPGLKKLRKLYDSKYFGRILSVRLEFGWWVFDGTLIPSQRPSWNYRRAGGGGLILDMFAHWRYIFDRLLGPIEAVSCRRMTAQPDRIDEAGKPYKVDV